MHKSFGRKQPLSEETSLNITTGFNSGNSTPSWMQLYESSLPQGTTPKQPGTLSIRNRQDAKSAFLPGHFVNAQRLKEKVQDRYVS
jgi:hypothetical protein